MKKKIFLLCFTLVYLDVSTQRNSTICINSVIVTDVPDMSFTHNDSDFYLISSTMHLMSCASVMKSKNLAYWRITSYVFDSFCGNYKYNLIDGTVYGCGQCDPTIRSNYDFIFFFPSDQLFKSDIFKNDDLSTEKRNLLV